MTGFHSDGNSTVVQEKWERVWSPTLRQWVYLPRNKENQ